MREEHCGCGGRRERPLQEVDFGALVFAGQGQNELRVAAGGVFDGVVGGGWDGGAEGVGGGGVAEAPEEFDFFGGEGEGFGDVEVGGEGFNAGGG